MSIVNKTLPVVLKEQAQVQPEKPFLLDTTGKCLTFAQLDDNIRRWTAAYGAAAISRGDRVATMMSSPLDEIASWLALAWIGGLEIPVNTEYRGQMLIHLLVLMEPSIFVISPLYLDRLAEVWDQLSEPKPIVVVTTGTGQHRTTPPFRCQSLDDFFDKQPPSPTDLRAPAIHDLSGILFTSGSTGPSKGVLIPWGLVEQTASAIFPPPGPTHEDVFYAPLPLSHLGPRAILTMMARAGGQVVVRERFSSSQFWPDIERFGCTSTYLMSAMTRFVLNTLPSEFDKTTSTLRAVLATPLWSEIDQFQERLGVRMHTWFGSTEVGVAIAAKNWQIADWKSCGQRISGRELRIADEYDQEVPTGVIGELLVRSNEPWTMAAGYWRMPEETVKSWRNLWFHTGDAMYRDEEGSYVFVDRMKDVIRRRGENVSSFEVESAVNGHESVLECAAYAVPAEFAEDEIMIAAVPAAGCDLTSEELASYLEPRLPSFMVPRYIEILDSLPKTPTQKVKKRILRERGVTSKTWDRVEKRFHL
jgi:crotonobetaine/carnitine-CoA ligase